MTFHSFWLKGTKKISYDPIFGFSGAPTLILRNYMEEQMLLAFEWRHSILPNPGVDCPPLVALSASEKLSAASLELVTSSSDISGIYSGNVCDRFRKANEKFAGTTKLEVRRTISLVLHLH